MEKLKQPLKTLTLSLEKGDRFDEQIYIDYSKFKHGSKTVARKFGRALAKRLETEMGSFKNKNLIIYSAPYNNVPTASNSLKDYMVSGLAKSFLNNNIQVKEGKIERLYSYTEDYGLMTKEQREKLISNDAFIFDKDSEKLSPDDVLVFVDDIKITGQHEVKIREMLETAGVKNEVVLIYLYEYTGDDASIEHRLNHGFVKDLKTLNHIVRNEEFTFNTRVVKYILNAKHEEFKSFITFQSDSFNETLFNCAVLNSYHLVDAYKENFDYLSEEIEKEKLQ